MTKNLELQLTNDYIFKRLFSKKGNEDILKDLLEGILEIPIKEVQASPIIERSFYHILFIHYLHFYINCYIFIYYCFYI